MAMIESEIGVAFALINQRRNGKAKLPPVILADPINEQPKNGK